MLCETIILQASLGQFDKPLPHIPQTVSHDYHLFTDENFPPRINALHPRLQAKIPKMFGWQLKPNYKYYLWLDGNIQIISPDLLQWFIHQLQDSHILVFRHPTRPDIRQENRYTRKGINQQSLYMLNRYQGELLKEQIAEIEANKDYKDDLLLAGGILFYHNTPEIQKMFKEWWYHVSRYIVQDQLSFPYVLKESGVKAKILDIDIYNWPAIKINRHRRR